jgi:4-amino-4-deoxy-L-arabinose transferase-like glycosyltransferase
MTAKAYRTSAAYDGSLAAADWCERHRWRVLMLGAPLVFGLLTAVATVVLESFPNSGDEYAYLYQARTLAEGRLTNPLPAAPEFFETIYIAHDRGRAYGTFPIGWPLLLAAAQVAGVPAVVVAPLLGVVTLVLMYLVGRQLYGPRAGMLAAAVTASCPFFIFNAASYFSHTWCGCLLLAAMLTAILALRRHLAFALAAGFLIGWAVLTRYLTGALVGVAIGVWLMRHAGGRRLAVAALVAGGGVPWLAFLAWHNAAMTGSAWSLTTLPVTLSLWFADGVLTRGPDILATQVLRLLLWTPPALMVVYAVYLRRARHPVRHHELEWLLVVMAVVLVAYVNRGGNQYGPRFYYEATLFAILFTTANLFAEPRFDAKARRDQRLWMAVAISIAALPVLLAYHVYVAGLTVRERRSPYSAAQAAGLGPAVVVIAGRVGSQRSMDARDLIRNDFAHANPVLFARDLGSANCGLAAAYPGRTLLRYEWSPAAGHGALQPIQC